MLDLQTIFLLSGVALLVIVSVVVAVNQLLDALIARVDPSQLAEEETQVNDDEGDSFDPYDPGQFWHPLNAYHVDYGKDDDF